MHAILDAAGTSVNEAYRALRVSRHFEPIVIEAGQLSCKKLILIPWQPFKTLAEALEQSVRYFVMTALQLASDHECDTLAFPALGEIIRSPTSLSLYTLPFL